MNKKWKEIECRKCHGTGKLKVPLFSREAGSPITEEQKKKAVALYQKGLSLRKIAAGTGIKHPQSVKLIITKFLNP